MSEKRHRIRKKLKHVIPDTESLIESDEYLGFIVGYTSNGVPFGLTHEELDKIKDDRKNELTK